MCSKGFNYVSFTFPARGSESERPSKETRIAAFFFHFSPQVANFSKAICEQIILEEFLTGLDLAYLPYVYGREEEAFIKCKGEEPCT